MKDDVFNTDRRLFFSIAYRMLGSASDAEDVLQDAWMRYQAADESEIRSPRAFVATIVSRLCLDRLKSAQSTREEYIGPWLPEPVLTSEVKGPDAVLQHAESITLAFLVLLEKLSPEERAVFLLKDIFEYEHAEIAEMLNTQMRPVSRSVLRTVASTRDARSANRNRGHGIRRAATECRSESDSTAPP